MPNLDLSPDDEAELDQLFQDIFAIVGTPERARTALRRWLTKNALPPPPPSTRNIQCRHGDPSRPASPTTIPTSAFSTLSISTVSSVTSPSTGTSRLDMTPTDEDRPWQITHVLTSPNTATDANPEARHIRLADSSSITLRPSNSNHPLKTFNYIVRKISEDSLYLGESELHHYQVRGIGFTDVTLILPPPDVRNAKGGEFYAVAVGRKVGIFATWFEAEKHVTCCPQNAHKKLKPYAATVAWMQAALLSGTIEVIPEAR